MIKIDIDSTKYTRFKDIVNTELTTTPIIIKQEYFNLIELLEAGQIYGALLKLKDCFEVNIKFPVITIMAYYWQKTIMGNLDNKVVNIFADELFKLPDPIQDILLTCVAKKMSFGEWEAACSAINNDIPLKRNIKEQCDDELLKIFYNINSNNYEVYCNRKNADNNIEYISAWRNETIGHGALNMNFEDVEKDVYVKLEILTTLLQSNEQFYQKINITFNEKKEQVINTSLTKETYKILITPFLDLLNCSNGRMFESFSKKKSEALLMNYSSGQKEKSLTLSQYFTGFSDLLRRIPDNLTPSYKKRKEKQDKSLRDELLSSIKDNTTDKTKDLLLDQKDIDLIQKLKSSEDLNHSNIFCNMFRELMELPEKEEGNIYLLCADRGMGKSTFCRIADELDSMRINNKEDEFTKFIDNHQEIIIRAYDCNSFYYSKTKSFLTQLLRAFTSELQYAKNGSPSVVQRINHSDKLLEAFNKLNKAFCEDNKQEERRNAFWQFLAIALNEWSRLKLSNGRQKLVLLIDGIDELVEGQDCLNPNDLLLPIESAFYNYRNIYLIFTCRTQEGNSVWGNIIQNFINSFKQENIRTFTIQDYSSEFITDVTNSFSVSNEKAGDIAKFLDYRYSYFAAYKKIYENMDRSLAEGYNNPFPFYFSYLKRLSKDYLNNVQYVFYLLAIAKDGMTFKELSYMLTGDGDVFPPVDFKLYGMLTDISGFLHYAYDEVRGYVITISHAEWRQCILEMQKTDKDFEKVVANIRKNAKERAESFLNINYLGQLIQCQDESCYDGEFWLLSHLIDLGVDITIDKIEIILSIIDLTTKNKIYQKYRAIDILTCCETYLAKVKSLSYLQKNWQTQIYLKRGRLHSEMDNIVNALSNYDEFIKRRESWENDQQYYNYVRNNHLKPSNYEAKVYGLRNNQSVIVNNDENDIITTEPKSVIKNSVLTIGVVKAPETNNLQDGYAARGLLYASIGRLTLAENDFTNAIAVSEQKLQVFGEKYIDFNLPFFYFQRGRLRKGIGKIKSGNEDIKYAIQAKIPNNLHSYLPLEKLELAVMSGELDDSESIGTAKDNFDLVVKSIKNSLGKHGYGDNLLLVEATRGRAKVLAKEILKDGKFNKKAFEQSISDYNTAIRYLKEILESTYTQTRHNSFEYTKEDLKYINYSLIDLHIEKAELYDSLKNIDWEKWKKEIHKGLDTYEQAIALLAELKRSLTKDELMLKMIILGNRARILYDLWCNNIEEYLNTESKLFLQAKSNCSEALKISNNLEKLAKKGKISLNSFFIDEVYYLMADICQHIDTKQSIGFYKMLIDIKLSLYSDSEDEKERKIDLTNIYLNMAGTLIDEWKINEINSINKYLRKADTCLMGIEKDAFDLFLLSYFYKARLCILDKRGLDALSFSRQGLKSFIENEGLIEDEKTISIGENLFLYHMAIRAVLNNNRTFKEKIKNTISFLKTEISFFSNMKYSKSLPTLYFQDKRYQSFLDEINTYLLDK